VWLPCPSGRRADQPGGENISIYFSFFAEAGIELGLPRGRKRTRGAVSLKPASNFDQQPSD